MPDEHKDSTNRTAGGPVHMLIGHAGAPMSWAVNPDTPPFYEAVHLRHGVHVKYTELTWELYSLFSAPKP